ncbi:MATE family efflux transporter [Tolumonas lignilytica]|uniref:MATE family efflux transporter n=1 Tax=Tolumonas lignilytica TaxID=1283284 RepID=UPI0004665DCE|nr:MATE family efflux transporter [Tolumonas lignilytica]
MTSTSVVRSQSLFQITWPLFIDLALHFLTAALNTFMVSHVSYQAVAALSVGNQLFDVSITLFNFVGIGSSVVITQYLGAGQRDIARRVVQQAIGFNALVGLVVVLGVIFGATPILQLMNMPAHLQSMGQIYLQIIALCLLPEAIALCLAASLRAYGYTREAMYVTVIVNLVTLVGNALLLYGWFGLPQMSVAGVACSTVMGRLLGVSLLVWLIRRRIGLHLHWRECSRFSTEIISKIMKIGLPAAGENLSWMLQMMVITSFVALLGDKMLATQSYFFQISLFVMLFGIAIGLGTEIMIGHLVGAGELDQAYHRLLRSLKIGLVVTIVSVAMVVVAGPHIMGLFTSDAVILATAGHLFLLSLILEPGRTFNIIVISSLRATGDARFPFRMALFSMWGIAIPVAYLCGIHWSWGLLGIWCGFVVDEWVRGLTMFWRWRSRRWEKKVLVQRTVPAKQTP